MGNSRVMEVPALGYGKSEAAISLTKKLESGEFDPVVIEKAAQIIREGVCMARITDKDDGCIDGRFTLKLLYTLGIEGEDFNEIDVTDPLSHKRYKVAGGGYITALAMKLALDPHITSANEDLQGVVYHLTHYGVYCGTHTGEHTHSQGSTDCGANDNFAEILRTGRDKTSNISATITQLMELVDSELLPSPEVVERADNGLNRTLEHENYFSDSNGKSRFDIIMNNIAEVQKNVGSNKPVSVSKHLCGVHNEAFIVINTVRGKTFSQARFQEQLNNAFPTMQKESLPQAFAVDLPRVIDLAQAMAAGRDDEAQAFKIALYAGLAFQFATAATLTDGTLRTFIVSS